MSIVAIDVGGTRIKYGLFSQGQLAHVDAIPVRSGELFPEMLAHVRDAANAASERLGLGRCEGISISYPGYVDPERGQVTATFGKFDDAKDFDLPGWIRGHWDVPFVIDNDARLALYGEWLHGAGRGVDDLIVVTLGTGFGTAALIDGRMVSGRHFQASNLGGHSIVSYAGRECPCGNRGCLEAEASTWALPEIAREYQMDSALFAEKVIDYEAVFRLEKAGDALAAKLAERSIAAWSAAMVNLIHAFDPVRLVIGGGIMRGAEIILPRLRERIHRVSITPWGKVEVLAGAYPDAAALWGGHALLMRKAGT
ncbi:MAG: ROK family protein [Chthoniobacteraceae bacterium]